VKTSETRIAVGIEKQRVTSDRNCGKYLFKPVEQPV